MNSMSLSTVLRAAITLAFLWLTLPDSSMLAKYMIGTPASNWLKKILGVNPFVNYTFFSLISDKPLLTTSNESGLVAYHIGIAGMWVSSAFWASYSGRLLTTLVIVDLVSSFSRQAAVGSGYVRVDCRLLSNSIDWLWVILFYLYNAGQLELFKSSTTSAYLVLVLVISRAVRYLMGLCKISLSPSDSPYQMIHALSSSMPIYLGLNDHFCEWNGYHRISLAQSALGLIATQVLSRDFVGLSGSLAAVIFAWGESNLK